ncbi:hypothetical protein [Serratia marcescens]
MSGSAPNQPVFVRVHDIQPVNAQ